MSTSLAAAESSFASLCALTSWWSSWTSTSAGEACLRLVCRESAVLNEDSSEELVLSSGLALVLA